MNIIDLGLQFKPMKGGNTPGYIGLHHSGGIGSAKGYHALHQSWGWAGLGYHFFVDVDGKVYKGRPVEFVPAAVLGHNQDSLQICANGNFENMIMPDVQKEAITELISYVKSLYPTIKDIKGHKELMSTDCPGTNYPLQEVKNTYANGYKAQSVQHTPAPIHQDIFKLQHLLNQNKITDENGNKLDEDGWVGAHTLAALSKITIHRGDNNAFVGWIQNKLGIEVDNIYGNAPWHGTYDAIIAFQQAHGLDADGVVGPKTWTELTKNLLKRWNVK